MSRRPELSLEDDGLMVRKGEARAVGPAAVAPTPPLASPPPQPEPARAAPQPVAPPEPEPVQAPPRTAQDDPPIVIGKRETIERVFTNVRIPVELDERLYRMMVETRKKKQQIIEDCIREGLERYERTRRRAGQGI
jgi:hypothetical protein